MKLQYKYLTFLSMLYMTIKLTTVVLIYKIVTVGPFFASASTLVIPLWFFLGDIITEAYGYRISRHIIWMAILCQFVFAFICSAVTNLNSPAIWNHQEAYNQVLGKLPRVAIASFLAITIGAFINAYALTKWKILLRGKYFWLRSLGATAIGELVFTIIAYVTEFWGITAISNLAQLMATSYAIKLLAGPILVIPASLAANLIKKLEGIDTYDYDTNLNPFYFGLSQNESSEVNNIHSATPPNIKTHEETY